MSPAFVIPIRRRTERDLTYGIHVVSPGGSADCNCGVPLRAVPDRDDMLSLGVGQVAPRGRLIALDRDHVDVVLLRPARGRPFAFAMEKGALPVSTLAGQHDRPRKGAPVGRPPDENKSALPCGRGRKERDNLLAGEPSGADGTSAGALSFCVSQSLICAHVRILQSSGGSSPMKLTISRDNPGNAPAVAESGFRQKSTTCAKRKRSAATAGQADYPARCP